MSKLLYIQLYPCYISLSFRSRYRPFRHRRRRRCCISAGCHWLAYLVSSHFSDRNGLSCLPWESQTVFGILCTPSDSSKRTTPGLWRWLFRYIFLKYQRYLFCYPLSCLDALLQYIWSINLTTFPHFQDLVESLQISPRVTRNKKIDTVHHLKFITWTLNINITLVKIIAPSQKTGHQRFCFSYDFQNTLIKLVKIPHKLNPIHVISYQKKYYVLYEPPTIFPLLLKGVNPHDRLTYKNLSVDADQVLNIIRNQTNQMSFPFTINIYTSYTSVKKTSKEIESNMIGQLLAKNSTDVFHVFVTPDMENTNLIRINALDFFRHSAKYSKHNLFSNIHITEGDKTVFHSTPKEVPLNQKSCICDHEQTQCFSPSFRYRNLGTL